MHPTLNDDIFKPASHIDVKKRKSDYAKSRGAWVEVAHRELEALEGIEIDITTSWEGINGISMESHTKGASGETEWLVFPDDESAERAAYEQVKDDLDSNPQDFNEDFITRFLTISDTDRRIIAGEEADARMDGMDERDILESTGNEQDYDEASESGNNEEMDRILDEAKDQLQEKYYDEIYASLGDPIDYFVNQLGAYSIQDLIKASFIQIDTESAALAAVEADGVSHYLDRYDGEETRLPSGAIAYGTN